MTVRTGTEHAALQLGHRFPRNGHRLELLGLGDEREGPRLHLDHILHLVLPTPGNWARLLLRLQLLQHELCYDRRRRPCSSQSGAPARRHPAEGRALVQAPLLPLQAGPAAAAGTAPTPTAGHAQLFLHHQGADMQVRGEPKDGRPW